MFFSSQSRPNLALPKNRNSTAVKTLLGANYSHRYETTPTYVGFVTHTLESKKNDHGTVITITEDTSLDDNRGSTHGGGWAQGPIVTKTYQFNAEGVLLKVAQEESGPNVQVTPPDNVPNNPEGVPADVARTAIREIENAYNAHARYKQATQSAGASR